MKNTQLLFVINPGASRYNHGACQRLLKDHLPEGSQWETHELGPEDFEDTTLTQLLNQHEYDVVVAAGGDGTVRKVITSIYRSTNHPRLGILPLGTGNILAKSLGIPMGEEKALKVIINGSVKPLQISRVNEVQYFALVVGTGIDAEIMGTTDKAAKRFFGQLAYWFTGLLTLFRSRLAFVRVRIDEQSFRTRSMGVFVVNRHNFFSSFLPINPIPQDEENHLHVFVFQPRHNFDYLNALMQVFTQEFNEDDGPIHRYTGKNVEIKSFPKMYVQADGDVIGKTPITISICKEKLHVMAPESPQSHLQSGDINLWKLLRD